MAPNLMADVHRARRHDKTEPIHAGAYLPRSLVLLGFQIETQAAPLKLSVLTPGHWSLTAPNMRLAHASPVYNDHLYIRLEMPKPRRHDAQVRGELPAATDPPVSRQSSQSLRLAVALNGSLVAPDEHSRQKGSEKHCFLLATESNKAP